MQVWVMNNVKYCVAKWEISKLSANSLFATMFSKCQCKSERVYLILQRLLFFILKVIKLKVFDIVHNNSFADAFVNKCRFQVRQFKTVSPEICAVCHLDITFYKMFYWTKMEWSNFQHGRVDRVNVNVILFEGTWLRRKENYGS